MLRNIRNYLIAILISTSCLAQAQPIRNDTPSNLRDLGANLNVGRNFSVDQQGRILIGTITPGTAATSLGKAEDAPHTTGDVGVMALGVRNDSFTTVSANSDYTFFTVNAAGVAHADINSSAQISINNGLLKIEDLGASSGDAIVIGGALREDALTVATSTTNDYGTLKIDGAGKLIIANAPVGEFWQACSASNTGTSDTAIKAAVPSNRIYVTSISCFNTATVASAMSFKDGSSQIYVGGIGNSTLQGVGYWEHSLPTPLRGTVNTAFNFAMATNATATTCCAAGFISVN